MIDCLCKRWLLLTTTTYTIVTVLFFSRRRPQRTSKQKALNQVKVWCGNISDADEASSGKRPFSDSDSDSFEKKMKMEEDSSDSDDEVRPPVTVRKVIKAPLNGLSRKQPLPENILVPDAHGVVTINQKQLPALSSGVYVMSKTAGIIKLDSNTSKIAASGGHTVIKVAPKIGQTSIKVVKRGEAIGTAVATGASVVATTATMNNGSKTTPTILNSKYRATMKPLGTKMIAHRRLPTTTVVKKPEPVKVEMPPEEDDDSDDGLEELPFPTDLPLPEPESPPGEFTLCPLTGKVVGQEYPSEEEGDAAVSLKQEVADGDSTIGTTSEYNSLDVLGDISACNILASGESSNAIKMETSDQDVSKEAASAQLKKPQTVESTRTVTSNQEELDKTQSIEAVLSAMEGGDEDSIESGANTNVAASSSSTSSILTTALSNANIEASPQPVAVSTGPTLLRKVEVPEAIRQKTAMNRHIINRTIVPKPAPQAIITRITPGCVNRNKQVLNKQKVIINL